MNLGLCILIGGGIGSLCRYWLSLGVYSVMGRSFPYGTLTVNVLGSFVMGALTVLLIERFNGDADYLRAFLLVGFLGGFTTFSTFSMETLSLLESGDVLKGLLNILFSIMLCLFAVFIGALFGRNI